MEYNIPATAIGSNLAATVASIDTVELFMRRPMQGLRERIEAATGRRAHVEDCRDRTGYWRGVRIIFNRPNMAALALIGNVLRAGRSTISRVDVAVDFTMESEDDAGTLSGWLDQYLCLKWRSPQSVKIRIGDTTYWQDNRRARNLVIYRKKANMVRMELRFLNSRAVQRAGLDTLEGLRNVSPIRIINHNIKAQRPTDRYVRKITRQTYQEELKKNRSRKPRWHPVADQYRSRIPARVRAIMSRIDAQSVKIGPGMERVSMDWLGIPGSIMWEQMGSVELKRKSRTEDGE